MPDHEVWVLVSDGSYLMMNSEIATSVRLGKKLNIVVLDNGGFGCIDRLQRSGGAPRSTTSSLPARGLVLPATPRASAPIRARSRALPSSKQHSPRYGPRAELRSPSSPLTLPRARMPAGRGVMSRSPRYPTAPRSPPPAPPTIWFAPSLTLPSPGCQPDGTSRGPPTNGWFGCSPEDVGEGSVGAGSGLILPGSEPRPKSLHSPIVGSCETALETNSGRYGGKPSFALARPSG